jgi:hypothetical protein
MKITTSAAERLNVRALAVEQVTRYGRHRSHRNVCTRYDITKSGKVCASILHTAIVFTCICFGR